MIYKMLGVHFIVLVRFIVLILYRRSCCVVLWHYGENFTLIVKLIKEKIAYQLAVVTAGPDMQASATFNMLNFYFQCLIYVLILSD